MPNIIFNIAIAVVLNFIFLFTGNGENRDLLWSEK